MIIYTGCGWLAYPLTMIGLFIGIFFPSILISPNYYKEHAWPLASGAAFSVVSCLIAGLIVNRGIPHKFFDKIPAKDQSVGHTIYFIRLEYGGLWSIVINGWILLISPSLKSFW